MNTASLHRTAATATLPMGPTQHTGEARQPVRAAATLPLVPHVCFVAPNIWPAFAADPGTHLVGGAEVQQSILARGLVRLGYRVSVICTDYGQPARITRDGIRFVSTFRMGDGLPGLRFIHPRLTSVWRAMREVDADIYYQRTAAMLTAVVAAFCRRHGRRSIYAGASDLDFLPGRQLIRYRRDRWLFERGLASVDAVVVQTPVQQALCSEHYRRTATVIPNCYEAPAPGVTPALPADRRDYVLWVAALRRGKRPEIVLDLARRLPHRRFVMIGGAASSAPDDRAYYESIERAAAALPNLEFVGFRPLPEAEAYFDRARLLLNTSPPHGEGMPNVFLQAWARGVPTVGYFDAGANRKGRGIYPVVADDEAAAQAIEALYEDSLHHARVGQACLTYFRAHHDPATVLARFDRLLRDLQHGAGA